LPLPWLTDISERLQSYVEQHFKNGFDYALELSQAKDLQEFALTNTRYVQKSVEALLYRDIHTCCDEGASAGAFVFDFSVMFA
jgi:hypothetical protein